MTTTYLTEVQLDEHPIILEEFGVALRTVNMLEENGILTVRQLVNLRESELRLLENFNDTELQKVRKAILAFASHGEVDYDDTHTRNTESTRQPSPDEMRARYEARGYRQVTSAA